MAESTILWTHCAINSNNTALQMACTKTPFLINKPNGALLDPHGSTCCPSSCSSLRACMFSSSSSSGMSLSVSVPSLSPPAFSSTSTSSSALSIPSYVSQSSGKPLRSTTGRPQGNPDNHSSFLQNAAVLVLISHPASVWMRCSNYSI